RVVPVPVLRVALGLALLALEEDRALPLGHRREHRVAPFPLGTPVLAVLLGALHRLGPLDLGILIGELGVEGALDILEAVAQSDLGSGGRDLLVGVAVQLVEAAADLLSEALSEGAPVGVVALGFD